MARPQPLMGLLGTPVNGAGADRAAGLGRASHEGGLTLSGCPHSPTKHLATPPQNYIFKAPCFVSLGLLNFDSVPQFALRRRIQLPATICTRVCITGQSRTHQQPGTPDSPHSSACCVIAQHSAHRRRICRLSWPQPCEYCPPLVAFNKAHALPPRQLRIPSFAYIHILPSPSCCPLHSRIQD